MMTIKTEKYFKLTHVINHIRFKTVLFVFFLLGLNPSHAQDYIEIDALFEDYQSEELPGIAVSVIKDDQVIYQRGFGMANLEYGIPIDVNTKFHIASLSKQFTAFLILSLQDEGLLSIDDDVRTYIPELPDYGDRIRVHHLLTHSSGLREQWRLLEMSGWRLDDVIKTDQILDLIYDQKAPNFEPGDQTNYSNSGYTLLAEIVERVTGLTFAEFAKQTIFEPLDMSESFFYDDHEEIMAHRAYSYQRVNGSLKKSNLNFATVGPTSLFTTIEDMNKWAMNFRTMAIGNERIFRSMNQPAIKNDGSSSTYAKGQFVKDYRGYKLIYHSGSDAGYRSYFARFPELGYQFIVFANASYISASDEVYKLIDLFVPEPNIENPADLSAEEVFQYDEGIFIDLPASEMKQFEGKYYNHETKAYTDIILEGDTLFYDGGIIGQKVRLHPVGDNNFKIKGTNYDISVNFKDNDFGDPILEFRIPDMMWFWLLKAEEADPVNYVGTYYCEELKTIYELVGNKGALMLKHKRLDDIEITQVNQIHCSSDNRNFSNIRFELNDNNDVIGFTVKNQGVKNIKFTKQLY